MSATLTPKNGSRAPRLTSTFLMDGLPRTRSSSTISDRDVIRLPPFLFLYSIRHNRIRKALHRKTFHKERDIDRLCASEQCFNAGLAFINPGEAGEDRIAAVRCSCYGEPGSLQRAFDIEGRGLPGAAAVSAYDQPPAGGGHARQQTPDIFGEVALRGAIVEGVDVPESSRRLPVPGVAHEKVICPLRQSLTRHFDQARSDVHAVGRERQATLLAPLHQALQQIAVGAADVQYLPFRLDGVQNGGALRPPALRSTRKSGLNNGIVAAQIGRLQRFDFPEKRLRQRIRVWHTIPPVGDAAPKRQIRAVVRSYRSARGSALGGQISPCAPSSPSPQRWYQPGA